MSRRLRISRRILPALLLLVPLLSGIGQASAAPVSCTTLYRNYTGNCRMSDCTAFGETARTDCNDMCGNTGKVFCAQPATPANASSCTDVYGSGQSVCSASCAAGETLRADCNDLCASVNTNNVFCEKSDSSGGGGGDGGGGDDPTNVSSDYFEKVGGVSVPTTAGTGLSSQLVITILSSFLSWFLVVFGILALIAFVISGLQYLLAAGDEKSVETAKRNMKWAIVGVIVALVGVVIIQAIDAALNAGTNF